MQCQCRKEKKSCLVPVFMNRHYCNDATVIILWRIVRRDLCTRTVPIKLPCPSCNLPSAIYWQSVWPHVHLSRSVNWFPKVKSQQPRCCQIYSQNSETRRSKKRVREQRKEDREDWKVDKHKPDITIIHTQPNLQFKNPISMYVHLSSQCNMPVNLVWICCTGALND